MRGDCIDIFPAHYEDRAWRVNLFGDEVESIHEFDPLTGQKTDELEFVKIYANSHYVTPRPTLIQAIQGIKAELKWRLDELHNTGRLLEAQRLEQRTLFDLEMMEATGVCAGIENYSRYLTGRKPGEPPPTLFEYVPDNALVFVDESHVTVPQIGGMYRGDFRRKATLAEYGFRLPSCMDNRPLRFEEWDAMRPQTVGVSATPGPWEMNEAGGVFAEQVIRPTGLIDPPVEVRPARTQVDDLVGEVREVARKGYRALVTVLTKRMAEDLTEYLHEQGIRVRYMHSDIDTIERIEIIRDLRLGAFDALVGINLLREGLDIPECALVAILDADKEGFLRSETSLIQTIGRAARNIDGKVILYADQVTGSMQRAMEETNRRREKQMAYNTANGITPESVKKSIGDILGSASTSATTCWSRPKAGSAGVGEDDVTIGHNFEAVLADLETRMREAAADLDFEEAARLRDELKRLRATELAVVDDPTAKVVRLPPRARTSRGRTSRISMRWGSRLSRGRARAPATRAARASRRSTRWARAARASRIAPPRPPRSTSGKPGMRGGWKPRGALNAPDPAKAGIRLARLRPRIASRGRAACCRLSCCIAGQSLLISPIVVAIGSGVREWHPRPNAPRRRQHRRRDLHRPRRAWSTATRSRSAGHRIRLFGIDAPEGTQDCRDSAGPRLRLRQRRARRADRRDRRPRRVVHAGRRQSYDRAVALCSADGRDLSEWMVRSGHALELRRISHGRYSDAEREARSARRGLWAGSFERPAEWRREHPR